MNVECGFESLPCRLQACESHTVSRRQLQQIAAVRRQTFNKYLPFLEGATGDCRVNFVSGCLGTSRSLSPLSPRRGERPFFLSFFINNWLQCQTRRFGFEPRVEGGGTGFGDPSFLSLTEQNKSKLELGGRRSGHGIN